MMDITEKTLAEQDAEDFIHVANSASGARFLSRLIDLSGVHQAVGMNFPDMALRLAFAEGRRNMGLRIIEWLRDAGIKIDDATEFRRKMWLADREKEGDIFAGHESEAE